MICTDHQVSGDQIKKKEMCGECGTYGEKEISHGVLVGRPERKRPLGRHMLNWDDNIKMDLKEVGWGDMDWIDVAQDRDRRRALVNAVMNIWVP
jgi:hypothetical protein